MTTHSTTAYKPIPSAFTCVEKPLRYIYDRYDPSHDDALRIYLAGMIVYPLVVCAAPVTMVADMTIGVAECFFCTLRGDNLGDVAELAKKKIIVSPLHHLIFITTSLAASAIITVLWSYNVLSVKFWLVIPTGLVWMASSPLVFEPEEAKSIHNISFPFGSLVENKMLHIALQIAFVVQASWNFISLLSAGQLILPKIVIPITITSLLWTYNYTLSQRLIGSFSLSWNHHVLSIFRDQGAPVKLVGAISASAGAPDRNKTFQDLAFTDCSTDFWHTHSPESFKDEKRLPSGASADEWKAFWTNFISNDRGKINPFNAHEKKLYNQFRDDVLAGKTATALLKLPQNPSKSDVLKAYKTYALVLHSDTNRTRFDEASVLFKCLGQAKYQLIGT